jgi:hypothetical protein
MWRELPPRPSGSLTTGSLTPRRTRTPAGPAPAVPYRALPRLRRRRSAGESLRVFGFAFDPRDPDPGAPSRPPPAPAVRARTGARRRASRQMKNEIPPSTMTAPAAIPIAAPPDSELVPDVPVVEIAGAAVAVDAVGPDGSDGENGLLPEFPAAGRTVVLVAVAASAATGTIAAATGRPSTPVITDRHAIRRAMRRSCPVRRTRCQSRGPRRRRAASSRARAALLE